MNSDLSIELRSEIIEIALTIEKTVNELLISYLNIENIKLKALSNKTGSFSFKNKIDLLFDLEILTKEEHQKLLLLMEFRNQFLHNYDCNSFLFAVEILGEDKGKQLIKYNDITFDTDLEYRYKTAYSNLFINCLDLVLEKYELKRQFLETRRKTITDISDYSKYIIYKDTELLDILMQKCLPQSGDNDEIIVFKLDIHSIIRDFTTEMTSNDEFNLLKNNIKDLLIDKRLEQSFFK